MEHYNVRFLADALEDVEEIVLYVARDSKAAALQMHDTIIERVRDLKPFPKRGVLIPDKKLAAYSFRMLPIGAYIAFYKIDGNVVHIHRVLHGARNYPTLPARKED